MVNRTKDSLWEISNWSCSKSRRTSQVQVNNKMNVIIVFLNIQNRIHILAEFACALCSHNATRVNNVLHMWLEICLFYQPLSKMGG
jgi:hypothetical protein